jgi:curved DNA-binding protein
MAEVKDYYELLCISRKATVDEIRKAFRKLAMQCHPDLVPDKLVAEEKFKEINEAYEVLSNAESRRKYDRGEGRWHRFAGFGSRNVRRQSEKRREATPNEGFRPYTERPEFRSFYEEFFKGRAPEEGRYSASEDKGSSGSQHGSKNVAPQRGKDIEGDLSISLEEVLHESIHTISVLRHNPVTGEEERRFLHVKVPAGTRDAQILKLPEKGDYGVADGTPGDLFLRIKVTPHADFRIRGESDVVCDIELTAWEAIFGSRRKIRTLDGNVRLKVPPGSLRGHRLRLRGRGLPKADGTRGDLYAVVSVKRVPLSGMMMKMKKIFRRR